MAKLENSLSAGTRRPLRGWFFTPLFVAWTVFECLVQSWRLVVPGASILGAVHSYIRGIAWLERHQLGLHWRIVGDLPRHGPALIAMKHQSAWETLKLHHLMDNPAIVIKRELLDIPFWGYYARKLQMIPIDRQAGPEAMETIVAASKRAVAQGRCIVIFPEGTRVPVGQHRRYKTGVVRISQVTGLPIIPVALNSGLFWPKHGWYRHPGTITLRVLEEIPAGLDAKEALRVLESRLEAASDDLTKDGRTGCS